MTCIIATWTRQHASPYAWCVRPNLSQRLRVNTQSFKPPSMVVWNHEMTGERRCTYFYHWYLLLLRNITHNNTCPCIGGDDVQSKSSQICVTSMSGLRISLEINGGTNVWNDQDAHSQGHRSWPCTLVQLPGPIYKSAQQTNLRCRCLKDTAHDQ